MRTCITMMKMAQGEKKKKCLICQMEVSTNGLINHIAEHINYKRHKCKRCNFKGVSTAETIDHRTLTGHEVEFEVTKNWYLDRVCQIICCDINYAEKNGEEEIRKAGSVYATKERLLELLRSEEIKDEIITIDDEERVDSTEVMDQDQQSHGQENLPTVQTIADDEESTYSDFDEEPRSSQQIRTKPNPMTKQTVPQTTPPALATAGKQIVNKSRHEQSTHSRSNEHSSNNKHITKRANVQTAPADSSMDANHNVPASPTRKKTKTKLDRCLSDLHKQITKGVEKRKCRMCTEQVINDYPSQKKHVIDKHMVEVSSNERQSRFVSILERCFKQEGHRLITNDFQCNFCGQELKTKKNRINHVAGHTDYQWTCTMKDCSYSFENLRTFHTHLNQFHFKKVYDLEGEDKERYARLKTDFNNTMAPLVQKCFPFDTELSLVDEDAMADDHVPNMPIRVPPRLVLPRASSTTNRRGSDKALDELPKDELKQEARQDTSSTANNANLAKKGNSSSDKRIESKPRTNHRGFSASDSSRASTSSARYHHSGTSHSRTGWNYRQHVQNRHHHTSNYSRSRPYARDVDAKRPRMDDRDRKD